MGKRQAMNVGRRNFLKASALAAGALPFAHRFEALAHHKVNLYPVADESTGLELLWLPAGFRYLSMSWFRDPMVLAPGAPAGAMPGTVPTDHDGGAVFVNPENGYYHYVRNCESSSTSSQVGGGVANGVPVYDPSEVGSSSFNGGGTTTVVFDPNGETNGKPGAYVHTYPSLAGTRRNCAGGPVGNSWFTCEENLDFDNKFRITSSSTGAYATDRTTTRLEDHGYVFEVPAFGVGNPVPIRAMGRFNHEAICFDPVTGYAYQTEDQMTSGFYRFRPTTPGDYHGGGTLEMLKIRGKPQHDTTADDNTRGKPIRYGVEWVTIDNPDFANSGTTGGQIDPASGLDTAEYASNRLNTLYVYNQGRAKGGATFCRGEGLWFHGDKIYFTCTRGGRPPRPSNVAPPADDPYRYGWGQVWEYNPRNETLTLIFTSQGPHQLVSPDNITVRPTSNASMILCEDTAQAEWNFGATPPAYGNFEWETMLRGLTPGGHIFDLAKNNLNLTAAPALHPNYPAGDYRDTEFTGAAFSPDGQWLFVNLFHAGVTFAITGDWDGIGLE